MVSINQVTLQSGAVIPVISYNSVMDGDGFYVSHNDYDVSIYGGETTALVYGQMQAFYILNGDHREAYSALIKNGFDACLEYFKANLESVNKRSDRLPEQQ